MLKLLIWQFIIKKKIWTKDRNRPAFLLSRLLFNKEGRLPFSRPDPPTGTLVYTDVVIDKKQNKKHRRLDMFVGAGINLSLWL